MYDLKIFNKVLILTDVSSNHNLIILSNTTCLKTFENQNEEDKHQLVSIWVYQA